MQVRQGETINALSIMISSQALCARRFTKTKGNLFHFFHMCMHECTFIDYVTTMELSERIEKTKNVLDELIEF